MKYTPEELQSCWNANRGDMLICAGLDLKNRRQLAEQRLAVAPDLTRWARAIRRINNNPFLLGRVPTEASPAGFMASFDWLMKPDTLTLIEEGTWDAHDVVSPSSPCPHDESYWEKPRPVFQLPPEEQKRISAIGPMALERERILKRRLTKSEQMDLINNNGLEDEF